MYLGYSDGMLMPVKKFNSNAYFGTRHEENGRYALQAKGRKDSTMEVLIDTPSAGDVHTDIVVMMAPAPLPVKYGKLCKIVTIETQHSRRLNNSGDQKEYLAMIKSKYTSSPSSGRQSQQP
ncbi:hypothetical protein MKX08_000837 [Trichoderma sp. CBMAI-0020]|nr:hypothetical protein MKX08_000837 [Trichoderma sp. CBMAI-0020]